MQVDEKWIARFNEKLGGVDRSGCIPWLGAKLPKGYGTIKIPRQRKQEYAHRLAWRIHHGDIPAGTQVLHRCDNPNCVNVEHLFLGTAKDNAQDMKAKSRHLFGAKNGNAALTSVDVVKIKALLAANVFSQKRIAAMFGVSQIQISRIKRGERWAHITLPNSAA